MRIDVDAYHICKTLAVRRFIGGTPLFYRLAALKYMRHVQEALGHVGETPNQRAFTCSGSGECPRNKPLYLKIWSAKSVCKRVLALRGAPLQNVQKILLVREEMEQNLKAPQLCVRSRKFISTDVLSCAMAEIAKEKTAPMPTAKKNCALGMRRGLLVPKAPLREKGGPRKQTVIPHHLRAGRRFAKE